MELIPFSILILPFINTPASPSAKLQTKELAVREFSLDNRYENSFVNDVFKDNILLTIKYAKGEKIDPYKINWKEVEKPMEYKLSLKPGETFAFHDDVLSKYNGKVVKTTNSYFNSSQGFKSDGYLVGDGVCHLASLIYWAAKDAGLEAYAPTNHDFADIPDVPREYGVSIYAYPEKRESDALQNLYITNNKNKEIAFEFDYNGEKLKIKVVEKL